MLQRTGEAETITTHYLFALGLYRGLYIPNWIYRYFVDDTVDPIAVVAGIVQTCLYADFFYSELSFSFLSSKFLFTTFEEGMSGIDVACFPLQSYSIAVNQSTSQSK